jgi:LysR family transcriptional regulator, hca operon transcriptional activator
MDLDLRYLRYFLAVAEELNFTKAAERLHTVQPSLSHQIHRLEEVIGYALFRREKHRIELTQAGRVFVEESRRLLSEMDNAVSHARQAAKLESGLITIGFLPGTEMKVFPRILPAMRRSLPELEISLRSMTSPRQLDALCNGEINVGFLRPPIPYPEIASFVFLQDTLLAVLPAKHKLARHKKIPPEKLSGLKFIGVSHDFAPALSDLTASILKNAAGKSILMAEAITTNLGLIEPENGFALLPDYVSHILPSGVVARPLDLAVQPTLDLVVAYRKDDQLPVIPFLVELLKSCI